MIKLKDIINEIYRDKLPRFLYHATWTGNLPSIKKHGLVPGGVNKNFMNEKGIDVAVYISNSKYLYINSHI